MKFQYRFSEICTLYVVLQNLLVLLLPVTIYKILKQICTTLKTPYKKRVRQKSLQDSPTIWRIGYREQSNLELNHSFFSKDHQALTEARGVPNFRKIISHVPCQCYSKPDVRKKKDLKKDFFPSEIPLHIALRLLLTPHLNMTDFHSYQQRSMQSLCFTVQVLALLEEEPLRKN